MPDPSPGKQVVRSHVACQDVIPIKPHETSRQVPSRELWGDIAHDAPV